MLLTLGKKEFPVDTNVGRICARWAGRPAQQQHCLCGRNKCRGTQAAVLPACAAATLQRTLNQRAAVLLLCLDANDQLSCLPTLSLPCHTDSADS